MKKWKVTGLKRGKKQTVYIEAAGHNNAKLIASKKHMLVVQDTVLWEA